MRLAVRIKGACLTADGDSAHGEAELQDVTLAEGRGELLRVLEADELDAQICVAGRLIDGENLQGVHDELMKLVGADHFWLCTRTDLEEFEGQVRVDKPALVQLLHAHCHTLKNLKMSSGDG